MSKILGKFLLPTGRINGWELIYYFGLISIIQFSIISIYVLSSLYNINIVLFFGLGIPFWYMKIMLLIQRFHDIGESGRNIGMLIVPFYNIKILVDLLFKWGERGKNDYGAKPSGLIGFQKFITPFIFIVTSPIWIFGVYGFLIYIFKIGS